MDVENVQSLKNLANQSVIVSLMKALKKRIELLDQQETETLKHDLVEETDNSENGRVDSNGENSLVLSYEDDEISCDLGGHSSLESGNDLNGKGQIEGVTDQSDRSENKFAMDKQDGSESTENGQIQQRVFGGDNGPVTDFAMDKHEGSESMENGQIQQRVFGGDNEQDTDFAMDKDEGSKSTENGQIQQCVFGGDNRPVTDFAMDKEEGSESTENRQIQQSVFGGDNRPDTDFVLHKQEGSECTENGQVQSVSGGDNGPLTDFAMDKEEGSESTENGQILSVFHGYGDNGPDKNQVGCNLDTETPCTDGSETHNKDYFDTFHARKYDDWSFVWNERNKEDKVSLDGQNMDYFENISLSGFTDGKTDERIIICEDDKFVYGNNLPKKTLG